MKKICSRCGKKREADDFYAGKSQCKPCKRSLSAAYYWANHEAVLAASSRYRQAHREQCIEAVRVWRSRNAELHRMSSREWHAANRERKAESRRRWYALNPDLRRAYKLNRRALEKDAFVEHVDRSVLLERDNGLCGICGITVDASDFHVDHIIPISLGGEHSYANTQPAHPRCNIAKRNRV